jgi:thioredoxin 1
MIVQIKGKDFDREVLESDIPVFVCFTTTSCGSCFALCIVVEMLASEYHDRIKFVMVDTEKEPEVAEKRGISPLPAVLLFHHGKPEKKLVGFHSKGHLMAQLDALLGRGKHNAPTLAAKED